MNASRPGQRRCQDRTQLPPVQVVPKQAVEPEHYTMSPSGLVHVTPGASPAHAPAAEFIPLGAWLRELSVFPAGHVAPQACHAAGEQPGWLRPHLWCCSGSVFGCIFGVVDKASLCCALAGLPPVSVLHTRVWLMFESVDTSTAQNVSVCVAWHSHQH